MLDVAPSADMATPRAPDDRESHECRAEADLNPLRALVLLDRLHRAVEQSAPLSGAHLRIVTAAVGGAEQLLASKGAVQHVAQRVRDSMLEARGDQHPVLAAIAVCAPAPVLPSLRRHSPNICWTWLPVCRS